MKQIVYDLNIEQYTTVEYKFPVFIGKIEHAHRVCTRPFTVKEPGDEARMKQINHCEKKNSCPMVSASACSPSVLKVS